MRKMLKKLKKSEKKLKNNQLYLYKCIYHILPIFDQSWKKERRRRQNSSLKALAYAS